MLKSLSRIFLPPGIKPGSLDEVISYGGALNVTTRVLMGTTPPDLTTLDPTTQTVYVAGDLYINTATSAILKAVVDEESTTDPKGLKWEETASLGTVSNILSGTVAPDPTAGEVGDVYYKTTVPQTIYQKQSVPGANEGDPETIEWIQIMEINSRGMAFTFATTSPTDPIDPAVVAVDDVWWNTATNEVFSAVMDTTVPETPVLKWVPQTSIPHLTFVSTLPLETEGKVGDLAFVLGSPIKLYRKELTDNTNPASPVYAWVEKASFSTVRVPQLYYGEEPPTAALGELDDVYRTTVTPLEEYRKEVTDNTDPENPVIDWVRKIDYHNSFIEYTGTLFRAEVIGDGSTVSFNVPHTENSRDIIVQMYKDSDGANVLADIQRIDNDNIQITVDSPLVLGEKYIVLFSGAITGATRVQTGAPVCFMINLPNTFATAASATALKASNAAVRSPIPSWMLEKIQVMCVNPGAGPNINVIKVGTGNLLPANLKVTNVYQEQILTSPVEITQNTDFEVSTTVDAAAQGLIILLTGVMK